LINFAFGKDVQRLVSTRAKTSA